MKEMMTKEDFLPIDIANKFITSQISIHFLERRLKPYASDLSNLRETKREEFKPDKAFLGKTKVIPLACHKGRLLFNRDKRNLPNCFSSDAIFPSKVEKNPPSKRCGCCPYNSLFIEERSAKCILIRSLLGLTVKEGILFSLSIKEEKAKPLELLLAAIALAGGDLSHYQVDIQITFISQSRAYPAEVKFSNLKKLKKSSFILPYSSYLRDWQPAWLRWAYERINPLIYKPFYHAERESSILLPLIFEELIASIRPFTSKS